MKVNLKRGKNIILESNSNNYRERNYKPRKTNGQYNYVDTKIVKGESVVDPKNNTDDIVSIKDAINTEKSIEETLKDLLKEESVVEKVIKILSKDYVIVPKEETTEVPKEIKEHHEAVVNAVSEILDEEPEIQPEPKAEPKQEVKVETSKPISEEPITYIASSFMDDDDEEDDKYSEYEKEFESTSNFEKTRKKPKNIDKF